MNVIMNVKLLILHPLCCTWRTESTNDLLVPVSEQIIQLEFINWMPSVVNTYVWVVVAVAVVDVVVIMVTKVTMYASLCMMLRDMHNIDQWSSWLRNPCHCLVRGNIDNPGVLDDEHCTKECKRTTYKRCDGQSDGYFLPSIHCAT